MLYHSFMVTCIYQKTACHFHVSVCQVVSTMSLKCVIKIDSCLYRIGLSMVLLRLLPARESSRFEHCRYNKTHCDKTNLNSFPPHNKKMQKICGDKLRLYSAFSLHCSKSGQINWDKVCEISDNMHEIMELVVFILYQSCAFSHKVKGSMKAYFDSLTFTSTVFIDLPCRKNALAFFVLRKTELVGKFLRKSFLFYFKMLGFCF